MKSPRALPHQVTPHAAFAIAGLVYAFALHAMLPAGVVPVGPDEFAYVKSVVQTVQHGRPWTNDYLEPWAGSLSVLAALVFKLTGSMKAAIHGLMVGLAAVSFAGLCLLLYRRLASKLAAITGAALIVSIPVLLRRNLEFIDLVVYWPSMIWALWAADHKRWGWFAVLWGIAVATRQSAVVWLILPAVESVRAWFANRHNDPGAWHRPALIVGCGLVWESAVALTMNVTDIQLDRTVRTFADLGLRSLALSTAASITIGLVAVGLAAFAHRLARGRFLPPSCWGAYGQRAVLTLGFILLLIDPRALVMSDSQYAFLYGTTGWFYAKLVVVMAAAGWIGGRFKVEGRFALCAVATIALVALRQMVFERYAFEISLLCFMAVAQHPAMARTGDVTPHPPRARWMRFAVTATVATIAAFHLWFGLLTKVSVDDSVAASLLHENALREQRLRPSELGNAPYPFRGWYLHPYAVVHPLPGGRKLAGFARFTQPTVEAWNTFPAWIARLNGFQNTRPPARGETVAEATYSVAWFWQAQRGLTRITPSAKPDPLGADFRVVPLPLSDAEWRQLVAGPPLR